MDRWFDLPGNPDSNVVYSRVRFVRNWQDYPFPGKMTNEQSAEMTAALQAALSGLDEAVPGFYTPYRLDQLSDLEKMMLLERKVINAGLLKKTDPCALVLSADERIGITLNGDDHVRIQAVERGLDLAGCLETANAIDDYIGRKIDYSFDETYGYLTAFPTNMGTGLRASVVVHLPLLSSKKNFNSLVADLGRFGTTIRGVYGEGSENYGSLYRVSNQKTLGQTEKDLVDLVSRAAAELDAQEQRLRKEELRKNPVGSADLAYKSYGVLKYARRLSRKDAMEFLSGIMSGVTDGILNVEEESSIFALMFGVQTANLLGRADRPLSVEEVDAARAEYLRQRLPEIR